MSIPNNEDIAVIGMAGIFPGANDLYSFWENILRKTDVIREVNEKRWRTRDLFDSDPRCRDKIYSKWGGFLEDIPFDPSRYGIPPVSLKSVEAVQLLALEITRLALLDTEIPQSDFPKEKTAVIFGAGGMHDKCIDYIFRTLLLHYLPQLENLPADTKSDISEAFRKILPEWTEDSFPGMLGNVISGRIANRFDMMGSNFTVDAACASSLAALDVGIAKLRLGQADAAIVGAVDITDNVMGFTAFAKTLILSPRGKSCPFDDNADGIVISEGAAAVVLKRLSDAEKNGDRIRAVIKGIGSSSDGKNRSLTAPHPQGQVKALTRAYENAQIHPHTIGLIEAHGTGTVVGDKSEVEALCLAFGGDSQNGFRCALGSVKSNIGHTKITAGLAGLIKGILAMEYKIFPPTMGINQPNSRIDFSKNPFYLNTVARPWFKPKQDSPRRCGVSAFGFGGTNFHSVLEEYGNKNKKKALRPIRDVQLFVFKATDKFEMINYLTDFLNRLKHPDLTDCATLAHALYLEKKSPGDVAALSSRLTIVTDSVSELKDKLKLTLQMLKQEDSPGQMESVYYGEGKSPSGKICFLFPGQGSQKINMLSDLLVAFPELQSVFEEADVLLDKWFERPLSDYVYPEPDFSVETIKLQKQRLNDTRVAQPALATANLIALDLLHRFGIHPDCTAGHSFGEYVALHAAGVIKRSDLIRMGALRGKISSEAALENNGKMAVIQADAKTVAAFLKELGTSVMAANYNSPQQVVVGGPEQDIETCLKLAKKKRLKARKIPVTAAFHTPYMHAAALLLGRELKKIVFSPPKVPVYSNTTNGPYPDIPDDIGDLLSRHIQEPLDFISEINRIYDDGARIFIEAGPGRVLSGLVNRILDESPHTTLALDSPGRSGTRQLAHLLAELDISGMPIDLSFWFGQPGPNKTDLEAVFNKADSSANPSPMTWRIGQGKIMPWHSEQADVPHGPHNTTKTGGCEGKPAPDHKEVLKKTPSLLQTTFTRVKAGQETYSIMKKENNNTRHTVVSSANEAMIYRIQGNLDHFIELQRDQQRLMERFLDMQQQLMTVVLNGNGSFSQNPDNTGKEIPSQEPANRNPENIFRDTPPAPVLPDLSTAINTKTEPGTATRFSRKTASPIFSGKVAEIAEFHTDLLKIVTDLTGYPEEMLDLDANLEADLGIDSIKRVEIFSRLTDHHQLLESQHEEMVLEELADLKSLRKIIEWYEANRLRLMEGENNSSKK